jgi:hypothetical protein
MSEIKKLTQAIRNYSEREICYGTAMTLGKIDKEADRLEAENAELKRTTEWDIVNALAELDVARSENAELRQQVEAMKCCGNCDYDKYESCCTHPKCCAFNADDFYSGCDHWKMKG